jgi:hypothetical protein
MASEVGNQVGKPRRRDHDRHCYNSRRERSDVMVATIILYFTTAGANIPKRP